jgi:hypothetical protein
MPNMMSPSSGLMSHISTDAKGSGTNRETIAVSKTKTPIQRAIKSHIRFIFQFLAAKLHYFMEKLYLCTQIQ